MYRYDVIYLVQENPESHGVFDVPEKTEVMAYCEVRSVLSVEYWRANAQGHDPTVVFVLSDYADYHGEKTVRWNNTLYRVIRTYINDQRIELTCEEAKAYDFNQATTE